MLTDAAVAALAAAAEPFAFFPAVRGIAANRWRFHGATRMEFAAVNEQSGETVWFARSGVTYVTVEEGAVSVTLRRELEYSQGTVWPAKKDGDDAGIPGGADGTDSGFPGADSRDELIPVVPVAAAMEPDAASPRTAPRRLGFEPWMLVLSSALTAAVALVLALVVARGVLRPGSTADSAPPISDGRLFTLVREDNYHDVVRKLGAPPENERALSLGGSDVLQRALMYPSRDYAVILLAVGGPGSSTPPHYIGAVRLSDGAVVASVSLAHDSTTDSLLKLSARQLVAD